MYCAAQNGFLCQSWFMYLISFYSFHSSFLFTSFLFSVSPVFPFFASQLSFFFLSLCIVPSFCVTFISFIIVCFCLYLSLFCVILFFVPWLTPPQFFLIVLLFLCFAHAFFLPSIFFLSRAYLGREGERYGRQGRQIGPKCIFR